MAWPTELLRVYTPDAGVLVNVGDVVTISLGVRSERYVVTHVHDDGVCDLGKEQA